MGINSCSTFFIDYWGTNIGKGKMNFGKVEIRKIMPFVQ
jgi:hypothetical protein